MRQGIYWIVRLLLTYVALAVWPVQAQNAAQRPSGTAAAQDMRAIRACFGTEPFWGLDIKNDELKFQRDGLVMELKGVKAGKAIGASESFIALYQGKVVGKDRFLNVIIMRDNQCSDGMSDRSYPARVHVLSGNDLYIGCCR